METKKILAGIVLYNPEISRLKDNIKAIEGQVDKLIIIDNGCKSKDYLSLINEDKAHIINLKKNRGIATALNAILQYALDNDYDWALTLDQDSVSPSNLVDTYKSVVCQHDDLGMVCCKIRDRNFVMKREEALPQRDDYVDQCITSASMVFVKAWQDVGGFDDAMFIDSVDFDFCLLLRNWGWKIFRTYKVELLHELGNSEVIHIFGKEYLCSHYPPTRHYYISRNLIYEGRKHHKLAKSFRVLMRHIYTTLIYENKKWIKLNRILCGLANGVCMPITKPTKREKLNHE